MAEVRRSRAVKRVEGRITAMSHVLRCRSCNAFLVQLQTQDGPQILVFMDPQLREWQKLLRMNRCYVFHDLAASCFYKGTIHEAPFLKGTRKSSFMAMVDRGQFPPELEQTLVCHEGVVTDVSKASQGMLILDGHTTLWTLFLDSVGEMPLVRQGSHVILQNVHVVRVQNERQLVMCSRSRMDFSEQRENYESEIMNINTECLPPMDIILEKNWSIEDYTWLQKSLNVIQMKFLAFFSSNELDSCRELLKLLLNWLLRHTMEIERSLILEFVHQPHMCAPAGKAKNPGVSILTVDNLLEIIMRRSDEVSCSGNEDDDANFWKFQRVVSDDEMPSHVLCGVLEIDLETGFPVLKDSTGTIPCVVLGGCENIASSLESVVVLKKFALVYERYLFNRDPTMGPRKVPKIYLQLCADDVVALKQMPAPVAVNPSGLFLAHKVLLHAKTAPLLFQKYSEGTFEVSFLALMSFHGCEIIPSGALTTPEVAGTRVEDEHERILFLLFKGVLLKLFHTLECKKMYRLVIPYTRTDNVFNGQFNAVILNIMQGSLPTTKAVHMPEETHLIPLPDNPRSERQFLAIERISVDAALNKLVPEEISSIKGILVSRKHQEPMYQYHFSSNKAKGAAAVTDSPFGIPGKKTLLLTLRDIDHASVSMCLYLRHWDNCQYPLSILPGCVLHIDYVMKKKSPQNSYLISTPITRVYALNMVDTCCEQLKAPGALWWGQHQFLRQVAHPPALSSGNNSKHFWTVVTPTRVLKIAILAHCGNCGAQVQNGGCTYLGCHHKQLISYNTSAIVQVQDGTWEALVYLQGHDVLVFLGIPQEKWEMLQKMAESTGSYLYLRPPSSQKCQLPHAVTVMQLHLDNGTFKRKLCLVATRNEERNSNQSNLKLHLRLKGLYVEVMNAKNVVQRMLAERARKRPG